MQATEGTSSLKDRRVLIVGASQGMGLGVARAAAQAGAKLLLASRSREKLERIRGSVSATAQVFPVDITDNDSVRALTEAVGELDHLVVTASPGSTGDFLGRSVDEARSYMEGKFWSTYRVARHAAERLPRDGSMVFVTGQLARFPEPGSTMVSSAFSAVEGLTRALAVELAPLRVNTIRPGLIDTPLWDFMSETERRELFSKTVDRIPVGRPGSPEDIGHAALFLMTNSFVSGLVIDVDGGGHLRGSGR